MRSTAMILLALAALPATTTPRNRSVANQHEDVVETIATFKKKDPGLQKFFDESVGYAVLPTVAKGAIGVGAAHGSGELLAGGKAIGKISMTQVTVGFQFGGQAYSEIIFFQNENTLNGFKNGDFAFAAQATAVALASGAGANASYRNHVAVFTSAKGGLMYEASIGGQKFSYKPYE